MIDSPETLTKICLKAFSSAIEFDQSIWKDYVRDFVCRIFDKNSVNDKTMKSEATRLNSICFAEKRPTLLTNYLLQRSSPLSSMVAERLMAHLLEKDLFNDFTMSLFSSKVTVFRRIQISLKYLTPLAAFVLGEHRNLIELKIVFDENQQNETHRTIERRVCPPYSPHFEQIIFFYADILKPENNLRFSSRENQRNRKFISTDDILLNEYSVIR